MSRRRPEIAAEAGRPLEAGYVPQTHLPAAEAEVDFHDLWVILHAVKTKTALFTMRLSFSGRASIIDHLRHTYHPRNSVLVKSLRWMVLDSAAIDDVDYPARSVLIHVIEQLHQRNIRFVSPACSARYVASLTVRRQRPQRSRRLFSQPPARRWRLSMLSRAGQGPPHRPARHRPGQ